MDDGVSESLPLLSLNYDYSSLDSKSLLGKMSWKVLMEMPEYRDLYNEVTTGLAASAIFSLFPGYLLRYVLFSSFFSFLLPYSLLSLPSCATTVSYFSLFQNYWEGVS